MQTPQNLHLKLSEQLESKANDQNSRSRQKNEFDATIFQKKPDFTVNSLIKAAKKLQLDEDTTESLLMSQTQTRLGQGLGATNSRSFMSPRNFNLTANSSQKGSLRNLSTLKIGP